MSGDDGDVSVFSPRGVLEHMHVTAHEKLALDWRRRWWWSCSRSQAGGWDGYDFLERVLSQGERVRHSEPAQRATRYRVLGEASQNQPA